MYCSRVSSTDTPVASGVPELTGCCDVDTVVSVGVDTASLAAGGGGDDGAGVDAAAADATDAAVLATDAGAGDALSDAAAESGLDGSGAPLSRSSPRASEPGFDGTRCSDGAPPPAGAGRGACRADCAR
jgi:hypothetical protein